MTLKPTPRTFAVVLAASALALSACGGGNTTPAAGGGTGGPEKTDLSVGVFTSLNALPLYMAIDNGIFEKHGLKVTPKTIQNPSAGIPQIVGNQMDFSLSDMVVPVVAKSQSVPVQLVAPGAVGAVPEGQKSRAVIYVAANSPVKTVKDLENVKFGVPQINSQVWLDVRSTTDAAGGDSSKMEFVEVPNTIAALKAGNVQAVTASEPQATLYANDPALKELTRYTPAEGRTSYGYLVTQQFAGQNPGTVKAFNDAILEANKLANADREKSVESALKVLSQASPEVVKAANYPIYDEKPFDAAGIQAAIDRVVKYGIVEQDKAPEADELLAIKN